MNLRNETDLVLIQKTESLVREERELLTVILHHLREIDRRRLFSSLKYKSLHEFTVKHLGYPDDQASRRISAMNLLRELPEVEDKINAGDLSLTHLNIAQRHFRNEENATNEPLSREQKLDVLNRIADKPVREAERITFSLSSAPEELKPDRIRTVSEERSEFKFTAATSTREKIETLKGWLAHKHPKLSLGELVAMLCDLGLEQWDPSKTPAAPRVRRGTNARSKRGAGTNVMSMKSPSTNMAPNRGPDASIAPTDLEAEFHSSAGLVHDGSKKSTAPESVMAKKTSAAQTRRDIFARAKNACENCGSVYALEIDHIIPQALGGCSDAENLRLLCRSCNQLAAVNAFGVAKMDPYLRT
jgi:hypothetical protein